MEKRKIVHIAIAILIISGMSFWIWQQNRNIIGSADDQAEIIQDVPRVACPQDAKLCSDGTQVERFGENCEFAPCSDNEIKALDRKFISKTLGIKLAYPSSWTISEQIDPEDNEKSIILDSESESWKLVIYENLAKSFLKSWFESVFDKENNTDCRFIDTGMKIGEYYTRIVKADMEDGVCDAAGLYANANDNSKTVKVEIEAGENTKNLEKILKTFEFVK